MKTREVQLKNNKDRDRFYGEMTLEQQVLFQSIEDGIFTFCEARAGSGKTIVAMAAMVDMLANGTIAKVVYIQKVSQRFLQNGFLPGSIDEKTNGLWTPVYDAMLRLGYLPSEVDELRRTNRLVLVTDSTLRGVNFEDAGVIIDEAENCDTETLKLIFTRVHDNCHVALIGDSLQKDNHGNHNLDFVRYGNYLADHIGQKVELTKNFRGQFSQLAEDFV